MKIDVQLDAVHRERLSQIAKWGHDGVESPDYPEINKLGILTEEFLEFTRTILDHESKERKLEELTQVAAVCVAWMESYASSDNQG